jgi:hypothetical protein
MDNAYTRQIDFLDDCTSLALCIEDYEGAVRYARVGSELFEDLLDVALQIEPVLDTQLAAQANDDLGIAA